MSNSIVDKETALRLRSLGFNEPVPHCYVHDKGDEYNLELFSFLLGGEGELTNVYEDEKEVRGLNIEKYGVNNESEIYFDYNQDIRKLLARIYNGEEYMDDPKSYNMNIDSFTYGNWTYEETEKKKLELPNYNDGDFSFSVYQDVVSAPDYLQVQKWLREVHVIHIQINYLTKDRPFYYNIDKMIDDSYSTTIESEEYNTFEEAIEHAIKHSLTLINE